MIPGLICNGKLWTAQIEGLRGVAEITVPETTTASNIRSLAAKILRRAPAEFALVGQSMGGYIALEIMRQAGERVSHLCLMSTQARQDAPYVAARRRGYAQVAGMGRFIGMSRILLKTIIHEDAWDNREITEIVYAMAKKTGARGFMDQTKVVLSRSDTREILPNITCPTLVLCGDSDERTPLHLSEEMADLIPLAELQILERCGHLPPLEKPAETTAAIAALLAR